MEWLDEIEERSKSATPNVEQFPTISEMSSEVELKLHSRTDMAKLIAAVRFATSKLREIDENASDMMALTIAGQSLTQLQSGEFPKEDA